MIGVAAANNGKAKEAADLAAELVHMGWGDLVSHTFSRMSHVCPVSMSHLPFLHVSPHGRVAKLPQTCFDGCGCSSGV